jgi:hypothetical protein
MLRLRFYREESMEAELNYLITLVVALTLVLGLACGVRRPRRRHS